jgi:hypothetical protein
VVIIHCLLRYVNAPGDDPSGLHNSVLGLMGDILPHQYPIVEVPGTTFHLVNAAVRVPTSAAMTDLIPTWADGDDPVLGPYPDDAPDTEVVRPRHMQLVPGRYASILVHRRRIRPKQAYQELVGAMQARDEVGACQDIVTWLRAACTARGGAGAQTEVPGMLHTFAALHLPSEAYRYVTAKVLSDLPAIGDQPGEGPVAATVAGALRALGVARGGRGDPEGDDTTRAREPKSIIDVYKETHMTLLRYCNATLANTVAPVWARLANSHKSEQHTVLTQELHKVCMARGFTRSTPRSSPPP